MRPIGVLAVVVLALFETNLKRSLTQIPECNIFYSKIRIPHDESLYSLKREDDDVMIFSTKKIHTSSFLNPTGPERYHFEYYALKLMIMKIVTCSGSRSRAVLCVLVYEVLLVFCFQDFVAAQGISNSLLLAILSITSCQTDVVNFAGKQKFYMLRCLINQYLHGF